MQSLIAAPAGVFGHVWRAYNHQLSRRPVATQMATSAALWACGDQMAQGLARVTGGLPEHSSDPRRTVLNSVWGGLIVGPTGHFWLQFLDKLALRVAHAQSVRFLLFKLAMDAVVWTPTQLAGYFLFSSMLVDRCGLSGFMEKMGADFTPSYAVSAAGWPPAMAFVFSRVPLEHQLLAVNLFSLGEAAFLSLVSSQDFSTLSDQLLSQLPFLSDLLSGVTQQLQPSEPRAAAAPATTAMPAPAPTPSLLSWLQAIAEQVPAPDVLAAAAALVAGAAALPQLPVQQGSGKSVRLCATITQVHAKKSAKSAVRSDGK